MNFLHLKNIDSKHKMSQFLKNMVFNNIMLKCVHRGGYVIFMITFAP